MKKPDKPSLVIMLFSLVLPVLFFTTGIAWGDNVTIITDMAEWKHPVKDVFIKYKVKISKVELYNNNTYPIFYVSFPYDPWLGHNDSYFKPLYYETLKANGFWDYSFIDHDSNLRINIGWDKKTKTLTEGQVDLKSPQKEGASQGNTGAPPPPPPLPD